MISQTSAEMSSLPTNNKVIIIYRLIVSILPQVDFILQVYKMNLISVLIFFVIVVNATESLVPPTLQSQGDWLTQFKENVKNAAIIKNLNDSYVAPVRCLKEILHIFAAAARTEMWALRGTYV